MAKLDFKCHETIRSLRLLSKTSRRIWIRSVFDELLSRNSQYRGAEMDERISEDPGTYCWRQHSGQFYAIVEKQGRPWVLRIVEEPVLGWDPNVHSCGQSRVMPRHAAIAIAIVHGTTVAVRGWEKPIPIRLAISSPGRSGQLADEFPRQTRRTLPEILVWV